MGDDLTVTNPERIEKAAGMGACNALLVKVKLFESILMNLSSLKMHCICDR